jgi:hypothetical protein
MDAHRADNGGEAGRHTTDVIWRSSGSEDMISPCNIAEFLWTQRTLITNLAVCSRIECSEISRHRDVCSEDCKYCVSDISIFFPGRKVDTGSR